MVIFDDEIKVTAKKMEKFRLVVWGIDGICGAVKAMDKTLGLIEAVEKSAEICTTGVYIDFFAPSLTGE